MADRLRDELTEEEERWLAIGRAVESRDRLDRFIRLMLDAGGEGEPSYPALQIVPGSGS